MEPDMPHEEVLASYEVISPEQPPQVRTTGMTTMLIAGAVLAALAVGTIALLLTAHDHSVISQQARQIRLLDKSDTRLADELSAQSSQLSKTSAKLSAADPSSDSALITCHDLRSMRLVATTGGSVSVASVPGSATVSLSQNPVPLPAHCTR